MKTLKSISVMALLFATAYSYANTSSTISSVQENEVEVISLEKNEPFFRKAGDKLYLNFFNKEMGDIQIRVVDSENRIVYSEVLKSKLVVEKAFNFGKAEKDSYKVVVKDGKDTYAEYYVVK
ncbi:hypothetical protein [Muriicola soli]|uniref:DUF3244 domain-containing protein n=1 Tax=Muriicola soli TaxID=2507538 RepID=A0A411E7E8_9FLAO|nr:hypothetical protein [Muriicola soli]QBA63582.1 hypothetical protein EQY75_02870 [Muriicola soli]